MLKLSKITVKKISYDKDFGNTKLDFNMSGPNIDYIVANTLRRTIFNDIPIYAFDEYKFEKNTSIFHNNYLKLRFRNMPVYGIENNVDYFEKVTSNTNNNNVQDNENMEDDVELEVEKNVTPSTLKQMTMYVNHKNKTNDIITVTTNDAKFYYDEKQIPSPYKFNVPLVKLQPNQEIAFSAITKLGIEDIDTIYSAVNVAYYKQNTENDFYFCLESRGQIDEKRILLVAFDNIIFRLSNFSKLLKSEIHQDKHNELEGVIIINDEDHTLGNLISRGMQQHSMVDFGGYNLPHPLSKKVHFNYKLNKGNIKNIMNDVIEYYNELFNMLKKAVSAF
jgi:DNA-directed RNA polymerase subunit L